MDYQKKKLLSQSVSFIQAHLVLTGDVLDAMRNGGVFTDEEISTIEKDDTTSGKVLELICCIKRKDNRTYSRFIQVLDERGCTAVSELLKSKGTVPENLKRDPRTMHYLESFLGNSGLNPRTMNDMASHLILKEVHTDEIAMLQEKIQALQRELKSKGRMKSGSSSSMSNSDGSARSTPGPTNTPSSDSSESTVSAPLSSPSPAHQRSAGAETPKWDVPSQYQELQGLLKQKDDILRRREEEYTKLRTVLTNTQNEYESALDLNSQYLKIIGQLNEMQMHAAGTPRVQDKDIAMLEMERQLEEYQEQIKELDEELTGISSELTSKESELQKVLRREKKYKDTLGLPKDATEADVHERIKQIIEDGSMRRSEVDRVKRELEKAMNNRGALQERVVSLEREKEKIEFHMRQQELTMRKMKRVKAGNPTIKSAEDALAAHGYDRTQQQMRLPFIERPGSQISLQSTKGRSSQQFCVFCRSEYQPLKAQHCRMHFRPIRSGKWTCCRDDSHRSAGCLQVTHFYVEITADKKIFLTDGARYMELS